MGQAIYQIVPADLFVGLTRETLLVETLLTSNYPYEQNMIAVIDSPDSSRLVQSPAEWHDYLFLTTKIERMESLSLTLSQACDSLATLRHHPGPVTAHLFISPEGSFSFKDHTDPDDVVLYMVEGKKLLVVAGVDHYLEPGQSLFIPAGITHQAFTDGDSLMLSFGLERWIEEKL